MELSNYVEYEARKKSYGVTYLLWILFGWIGLHRFWIGDKVLGVLWIVLTYLTFYDPHTFFKIYLAVCLVEWVAIGLRVKAINDEALYDALLKHEVKPEEK